MEGTRLYMLLLEAGGPLPSDVPAAPSPPPQLCRPAPCRKVAAGPGQRPRGGAPALSQDRAQETRCLPPSTIFVCSIRGAVEREGGCRGRGQWRGGVGRAIRKETAGQAAGRTCRDPPTEQRNSETEEAGGVGARWGQGARQRKTAEDQAPGPGDPGGRSLVPSQGTARPPPHPCPRTRHATRARARTHATPAAPPGAPNPPRARAPSRPPPAAGASRPVAAAHLGPRAASAAAAAAQSRSPGAWEGAAVAPAPPPPGPARRAPDARLRPPEHRGLRRRAAGRRPPGPRARATPCGGRGPGPVRAGSHPAGGALPDPPHPGALRRLWAAPAGEGGVPGHPGGPIGSLASDPSLLDSLPRPLRPPPQSAACAGTGS